MPAIFRKLFGISGAIHSSFSEKNQTVEENVRAKRKVLSCQILSESSLRFRGSDLTVKSLFAPE